MILAGLEHAMTISQCLENYPIYDEIFIANWVKVDGTLYRPGMVVTVELNEEGDPLFGCIQYVLVDNKQNVKFCLEMYDTIGFSDHFHSYEVQASASVTVRDSHCLLDYHPLHAVTTSNTRFISARFRLF